MSELQPDLLRGELTGINLGCIEVGILLNQDNLPVPVFDTTMIHCDAAIDSALEDASVPAN